MSARYGDITADCFPTPDLAYKSNDPAVQQRVREFAKLQASAAKHVCEELLANGWGLFTPDSKLHEIDRVKLLRDAYQKLRWWRYGIAAASDNLALGRAADRFLYPLHDTNYDRLGYVGRLREGATWNDSCQCYIGGKSTPAFSIMLEMGNLALRRLGDESPYGEVLQNRVQVGDGLVHGNQLLVGDAASAAATELLERQRRRGNQPGGFDVAGELIYAATATFWDRDYLHYAALLKLASNRLTLPQWCDATYLLMQAPLDKKGSDAVNRTFAVAVGALAFGEPPRMAHDVDLRAMVVGQSAFVEYLAVHNDHLS